MASRPPPLLLTKRLTAFLALNLTPALNTLLLLTLDGKLLAYASNPSLPVTTLRTHGTVAASLYAIHTSGTDRETVRAALGGRADGGAGHEDGPLAVTIQLESGVVLVIRRLKCAMLFVAMGPPPPSPSTESTSRPQTQHQHHHQQQAHLQPLAGAITGAAAAASAAQTNGGQSPPLPSSHTDHADVASILSAGTGASSTTAGSASVMATRRHAEELARWLDEKLGALDLPPMGFGGPV